MKRIDFSQIVSQAWQDYDPTRPIKSITDISVQVSTNHVYKVQLHEKKFLIAKLSLFGKYEDFEQEHAIINVLAQTLDRPYDRTLSHSLIKQGKVFTYRHQEPNHDVWVVFYRPVRVNEKLPKRLTEGQVVNLGKQMARFHKACAKTVNALPPFPKTLESDVDALSQQLGTPQPQGAKEYGKYQPLIQQHCDIFLEQCDVLGYENFLKIPVFVDWNIGNFSLTKSGKLSSRWDYDWFRVATRVIDFYFLSRVVSNGGDQTIFSYLVDPLMEDRFLIFLRAYHGEYPLSEAEIRFIKESYRFFILHYVINYGRHFFTEYYGKRLQQEAFEVYLPRIEQQFDTEKLLSVCKPKIFSLSSSDTKPSFSIPMES